MSVVLQMKAVLARTLIDNIVKADYLEGLSDEIRKLAESNEDDTKIIKGIVHLYGRAEDFRAEVLDIIRDLSASTSDETEDDDAP